MRREPDAMKGLTGSAVIGIILALCIITAWVSTHVAGVFLYTWGLHSIVTAPLLAAVSCWLFVGLFIVAHDCMHGSLAPHSPALNRFIGQLCLLLYAGFAFDQLNSKHHLHHRHSGTDGDPDFISHPPHGFIRWYASFFFTYFGWRQFAVLSAVSAAYLLLLDVSYSNLLAFWALPAIASSLQLFYFGTYLPHKPGPTAFSDRW